MSFLTKPSVTKGQPSTFTLLKDELVLIEKVASDEFFSDITNWKRVSLQFKNTEGQEEVLVFDASVASPFAIFNVSLKARSDYQLRRVIIKDLDNGTLVIKRADLSPADLATLDVPVL
jgi:hypothetical protein